MASNGDILRDVNKEHREVLYDDNETAGKIIRNTSKKYSYSSSDNEQSIWGFRRNYSEYDCSDMMQDLYPNISEYTIPRSVMEMPNITPDAKKINADLSTVPNRERWYRFELAGLCGMSLKRVERAIVYLTERGLLRVKSAKGSRNTVLYCNCIRLPSRFDVEISKRIPRFLYNDISDIEHRLKVLLGKEDADINK